MNAPIERTIVATEQAPRAIGPYSQAVRYGDLIYTAGQVGMSPTTGGLVDGGVKAQTEQVLDNLAAVLAAAGSSFTRVVKTTVFLTDLADFGVVNEAYGARFPDAPPARSTVQVAALPLGARVEIEAVAVVGPSGAAAEA